MYQGEIMLGSRPSTLEALPHYSMPTLDYLKFVFQKEFGEDFFKLPNKNNTAVVIIQHGFTTIKPLMDAFLALGIKKKNIYMTTKPHTTPSSMLEYFGNNFENYIPFQWQPTADGLAELTPDEDSQSSPYRRLTAVTHRKLFRRFCDHLLRYPQPADIKNIIICDEGGIFLNKFIQDYQNPDPRYHRNLSDYRVVAIEHTKSGTYSERLGQMRASLINMAESDIKARFESEFIAESMFLNLRSILDRIINESSTTLESSLKITIGIVGLGNLGREMLAFLKKNYPELSILLYDTNRSLYTNSGILELGLEGVTRAISIEQLFEQSRIILGCTGKTITETLPFNFFETYSNLSDKDLVSCSSGDREFLNWLLAMPGYQFKSIDDIQDYLMTFNNDVKLTIHNGGFPINFLAKALLSVSAKKVQITRALKLAALVQALKLLELMPYLSHDQSNALARPVQLDAHYQWEIIQAFYSALVNDEDSTEEQRLVAQRKYGAITQEEISQRSVGIVQPTIEEALDIPKAYAEEREHIGEELKLYVSPFCCDENSSPDDFSGETKPLLEHTLVDFAQSNQKIFLMKSESGGGKTLAGCSIELKSRQGKLKLPRDTFFIFISLPSLRDPVNHLINEYFHRKYGNNADKKISELKNYRICFILDAYDEIEAFQNDITQVKNLYVTNRLHEWPLAKFIISCRSSFLNQMSEKLDEGSYKSFFAPVGLDQSRYDLLKVMQVVLFSPKQIDEYIEQYACLKQVEWNAEEYKKNIRDLPGIVKLIKSPLLLKMTVESLPTILEWHQARVALGCSRYLDITERDVFLAYLKINLLRQKSKVLENSGRTPPGFLVKLLQYLLNLCHEMNKRKLSRVEYYFQPGSFEGDLVNDGEAWATKFFGDPFEGKNVKALQYLEILRHNLTCFFKYERGAWGLVHDSYIGRFNSINTIEITKIKPRLISKGISVEKIQQEAISEFSRVLFDEAAGPYYLTRYGDWAEEELRETLEISTPIEFPVESLPLGQEALALELRKCAGDPELTSDERYSALVKISVESSLHMKASSNGNTALHWLLVKFELKPVNQEKKLITLLNEINAVGQEAAEVLNQKNNQDKTVIDLFEEKKPALSSEVQKILQTTKLLLGETAGIGMRR